MGVALIASGLTVLLVMWRTLWPGRAIAEGWTVPEGRVDVETASPSGTGRVDGGGRRRRGRRRATRTGLFRRQRAATAAVTAATVTGSATTTVTAAVALVPQQRVGAGVRATGAPVAAPAPQPGVEPRPGAERPTATEEFDWFDHEVFVPVIGTTVTGEPFRGVAPVPDGRHRRR
ncbi:hypothetical protein [Micromonospora sp. LOL_023]|uniref:hypothetical protein n=1 Tax=Micromonospora sp. LOL_023 TaxID=3345418 RepID=UPI003A896026